MKRIINILLTAAVMEITYEFLVEDISIAVIGHADT